jgi:DNA processing protein
LHTDTSRADILYWLAATRLPGVGPITLHRWLQTIGDLNYLFTATTADLKNAGLTDLQIQSLTTLDWNAVEKDYRWCEQNHCHLLTTDNSHYPPLLKQDPGAPLLLYVQGDASCLTAAQIAMVGSRNPTPSGKNLATDFAHSLAKAGLVVTSGLALGIDSASHQGALQAGGKTIAVLGAGFKHIYPRSNQTLAESICASGALVTEFAPSEMPKAQNFPQRNRIISALSLGVLVVEAALRSGSLITARFATEQGREVFAIPGSIHNPLARGCHQLIRQGAKLVETAHDILEELGTLNAIICEQQESLVALDPCYPPVKSGDLIEKIGYEATSFDTIIVESGLTAAQVSSMLLSLELEGRIQAVTGGYVRVVNTPN